MVKSENSLNDSLHNMRRYAKLCMAVVLACKFSILCILHITEKGRLI